MTVTDSIIKKEASKIGFLFISWLHFPDACRPHTSDRMTNPPSDHMTNHQIDRQNSHSAAGHPANEINCVAVPTKQRAEDRGNAAKDRPRS